MTLKNLFARLGSSHTKHPRSLQHSYRRITQVEDAFGVIGDVHGQADALIALLRHMGYGERRGVWRYSERRVIFVGDFIDRGPRQVESVMIARRMVDTGSALDHRQFMFQGYGLLRRIERRVRPGVIADLKPATVQLGGFAVS